MDLLIIELTLGQMNALFCAQLVDVLLLSFKITKNDNFQIPVERGIHNTVLELCWMHPVRYRFLGGVFIWIWRAV